MSSVTPTRAELQQTEAFVQARVAIGTVVNKCCIVEEVASQGDESCLANTVNAFAKMDHPRQGLFDACKVQTSLKFIDIKV